MFASCIVAAMETSLISIQAARLVALRTQTVMQLHHWVWRETDTVMREQLRAYSSSARLSD
jgi:hypothetical protein